jgi:hypothetical protein
VPAIFPKRRIHRILQHHPACMHQHIGIKMHRFVYKGQIAGNRYDEKNYYLMFRSNFYAQIH